MATTEPVRYSHLKKMAKSAMHYQYTVTHESRPTPAMQKGTGVHGIVSNTRKVIAYDDGPRKGAKFDAFAAAHEGYEILTPGDYDKTMGMVDAVRAHPEAMELLTGPGTRVEQTLLFDYCGRPARTTPDAFTNEYAVELKTTSSSEPDPLMRQCQRMFYHAQMAFHLEGMFAHGMDASKAYIVAVEASAPYPVTILRLSPETLGLGSRLIRLWLERLTACEAANQWPPYAQTILEWHIEEEPELTFAEDQDEAA